MSEILANFLQDHALKNSEPLGVIRAGEILARSGRIDKAVETSARVGKPFVALAF